MPTANDQAQERIARLMDGCLSTQVLYVAAELGIADALTAGPRTAEEVATAVMADAGALRRVLRALAADGVLDELKGGRFGLTATGALLRPEAAGSQLGAVLARGRLYYTALAGLLGAVREGGTAFARVHGTSFFDYLAAHPAETAAFQASMANRSRQEAAAVIAAYDFGRFRRLVDAGGGRGGLLAAILSTVPDLHGVLFDRPEVVDEAHATLTAAADARRWTVVGGDFFVAVPEGGDAYLLSRVLHDWDDDDAVRILTTCRRAIPADGALLVVEAALPERAADRPAVIRMDLHMLALLGGRERTAAEYAALLARAGFRLARVIPTETPAGLSVLECAPEPR